MAVVEIILIIYNFLIYFNKNDYDLILSLILSLIFTQVFIISILKLLFIFGIYRYLERFHFIPIILLTFLSVFNFDSFTSFNLNDNDIYVINNIFFNPFFIIIFSYLLISSIFGQVVGGDTTQYNVARLFLYRQSETLYPIENYITYNQLFFHLILIYFFYGF